MTCITCKGAPMKLFLPGANEDVFKCGNNDCKTQLKVALSEDGNFTFVWHEEKQEVGTGIQDIVDYLREKSTTHNRGKAGKDVYVEKEMLEKAAVYLEDYLYMLDELKR